MCYAESGESTADQNAGLGEIEPCFERSVKIAQYAVFEVARDLATVVNVANGVLREPVIRHFDRLVLDVIAIQRLLDHDIDDDAAVHAENLSGLVGHMDHDRFLAVFTGFQHVGVAGGDGNERVHCVNGRNVVRVDELDAGCQ